jgi:hypothetical protein
MVFLMHSHFDLKKSHFDSRNRVPDAASCLPSTKAKEAVRYVIGTVLDFNPVDDCPLWLALIYDATDESQVNLYNQWLWLTPDDILALQYCPDPSKQKIVPLSRGYHTHVTRFKAMYSEL